MPCRNDEDTNPLYGNVQAARSAYGNIGDWWRNSEKPFHSRELPTQPRFGKHFMEVKQNFITAKAAVTVVVVGAITASDSSPHVCFVSIHVMNASVRVEYSPFRHTPPHVSFSAVFRHLAVIMPMSQLLHHGTGSPFPSKSRQLLQRRFCLKLRSILLPKAVRVQQNGTHIELKVDKA